MESMWGWSRLLRIFVLVLLSLVGQGNIDQRTVDFKKLSTYAGRYDHKIIESVPNVFISGGKKNSQKVRKFDGRVARFKELALKQFYDTKLITRVYVMLIAFCTATHMIGVPAPVVYALDVSRFYEIWRPFTASAFFGSPNLSLANNLYFLLNYGQKLEELSGSGEFAWFMLTQVSFLSLLSAVLGFPFQSHALMAAIVYISSRVAPFEKMGFQFGLIISAWQLPFCMMLVDCLVQQSPSAAWPHLLGMVSGHMYHFLRDVWPAMGGRDWLKTPSALLVKLGGKPGVHSSSATEETTGTGKRMRKPSGGRIIGGE